MSEGPTYAVELDERGRLCPLPVIALARAASGLAPGQLIRLVADDPAAASDVPAWCRMRGHLLVSAEQEVYVVRIADASSVAPEASAAARSTGASSSAARNRAR